MKITAFAGSNSKESINKQLTAFACSFFKEDEVNLLDLNDYEMEILSVDKNSESGVPQKALDFAKEIDKADLIILSLAEHNGAYSSAFKNIFDWISLIPNRSVFNDKPIFLMATSPGARGGGNVLEIAKARFPFNGGNVIDTFSLPSFGETFEEGKGIINSTLLEELENKLNKIKQEWPF